jgi:peroxiredoxin Q/BCP
MAVQWSKLREAPISRRSRGLNVSKQLMKLNWLFTAAVGLAACILNTAAGPLKVGDDAPDFKLQGSDGKTYKLSDFKGKKPVVLAWFPKAFTPGCTAECKSLRENSAALQKLDAAYFTASVDTPEQNKKFAESLGLDYPILSDPTTETAKAYGVYNPERKIAMRNTFYIGKDGKIAFIDQGVKPAEHGTTVAAKLKEIGATEKK